MIQNILTFCVKNDLTFVDGSLPSGKLVANDINRNSIYLITPFDNAIVKANFQTNLQSDKPTSVLGILVDGKIEVKEIVSENATYYPLVKDWHIYEFKVPSKTLQFISRNRTGQIGINFSIEQRLIPTIKPTYGVYGGEVINGTGINTPQGEVYYYINKTIGFNYYGIDFDLNDIVVDDADNMEAYKISAYSNRGSTPTTMFSVDPSVLNDNFETIEPSLTSQIVSQVNENVNDIVLILQAIGVSDATLVSFGNRISVAEQDIDKIEDGTTVVGKALKDDLGNTIKSTYANKLDLVYSSINNRIAITLKSYDGTPIDADLIDLPKATPSADGLLAKEDKVKINNIASDIASMGATKQSLSEKNQINGYAGLDANAKIPSILLPDSVLGQLEYKGTFTPTAYPSTPEKGWFYISIGNGTISGLDYKVGDWAVFNGSTWDKVDNTDAVASVNGKLGVVVINGTDILVGNGDAFTIEQRIVSMIADINDRYTKAQTYSQNEIEQRLTDLLGMANLQDTAIEFSSGVYDLTYNGSVVSPFAYSLVSPYNWVILRVLVGTQAEYTMFKPTISSNGVGINLPLVQKDVYAQVMRNGSNLEFSLKKKNDNTLDSTTAIMRAWGIKLDGIAADEISYDGTISGLSSTNVKTAIDELASEKADKTYVDAQDLLKADKTYVDNELALKADKLVLTNLASNGDFSNGGTGWTTTTNTATEIVTFTDKATLYSQNGTFVAISKNQFLVSGNKYYVSLNTTFRNGYLGFDGFTTQPLFNSGLFNSFVDTAITSTFNIKRGTAVLTDFDVDNIIVINLTATFGSGNEPSKEVMDRIIQAKGFFQTTDITIKDLFNVKADKLVLTNLVSNGDLLVAKPSPNENQALGFEYIDTANISLSGGVAAFTANANLGRVRQLLTYTTGNIIYRYARVKSDSNMITVGVDVGLSSMARHSGSNQFEFLSTIQTSTSKRIEVIDYRPNGSTFTPIEVDYLGAIDLTATFGAGKEPTKEQMDAIIKLKGYFDTAEIDLKDLMLLGFTQETRMTPTLTNATTTYLTYRKDDLGYVDIAGNLTITTFGTNLTLPVGYRPLTTLRIPVVSSTGTFGYVTINTNGTVVSNANATIFINTRFATI